MYFIQICCRGWSAAWSTSITSWPLAPLDVSPCTLRRIWRNAPRGTTYSAAACYLQHLADGGKELIVEEILLQQKYADIRRSGKLAWLWKIMEHWLFNYRWFIYLDLAIKHGDFHSYVSLPESIPSGKQMIMAGWKIHHLVRWFLQLEIPIRLGHFPAFDHWRVIG